MSSSLDFGGKPITAPTMMPLKTFSSKRKSRREGRHVTWLLAQKVTNINYDIFVQSEFSHRCFSTSFKNSKQLMQHASFPHSHHHFVFYTSALYLTSTHNCTLMREQLVPCYRQKTFTLKNKIEVNMIMLFPFISTRSNTQSFKEEIQIM